jgi:hypothetical protein
MLMTHKMPGAYQDALSAMVKGGALYVVVGTGERCHPKTKIGSGIILSDEARLEVSPRAVRLLERFGTRWDQHERALVLTEEGKERAGPIVRGRDIIYLDL